MRVPAGTVLYEIARIAIRAPPAVFDCGPHTIHARPLYVSDGNVNRKAIEPLSDIPSRAGGEGNSGSLEGKYLIPSGPEQPRSHPEEQYAADWRQLLELLCLTARN